MKKNNAHIVASVLPGSIAEELSLVPGDEILAINGKQVEDVFDYRYLLNDEYVTVLIRKADGEEWELEIEKEYEEDLGIEFENSFMDSYRSCSNHCIFCFIDQMPPGMRETLYFKDDDSRLSFLQGNYVTLTNLNERDLQRIIDYRMEPINVSFQTMNPELRCSMLHNRFAGEALKKVDVLYDAGITMNGQIVLCKGFNDGAELEYSLEQMARYAPTLQSVSVVPVGLSRYRDGLEPLEAFSREDAKEVLEIIHKWQRIMMERYGIHFIHASDEWYILAEQELPPEDSYDGYLQLENGVGMLRLLEREIEETLEEYEGDDRVVHAVIATGYLAATYIRRYADKISRKFPRIHVEVVPIRNDFFGETITVSGLVTGQDLLYQLKGKDLGEKLLLPCNMLRDGEDVFLDDLTVKELAEQLNIKVVAVGTEGKDFVEAILESTDNTIRKRRQMYEQTGSSNCGKAECGQVYPV